MIKQHGTYVLLILFLLCVSSATSQHAESGDNIESIIESLAETLEEDFDYSYLTEKLQDLADDPVNINDMKEIERLTELHLLDDIQINDLKAYIHRYDAIRSIYELQYVNGFGQETARRLSPFITFENQKEKQLITPRKLFKYGRHDLLLRFSQILEKARGYAVLSDSAWISKPNSRYLGNPEKIYLKYKYELPRKLKLSFLAEKDAGEIFLNTDLPDSVKKLTVGKLKKGFDFYSGSLLLENMGIVEKLVIGDFHPMFGQGLTCWSGFSMGMSSDPNSIKKYARKLRPNTSANENGYLRGGGTVLTYKKMNLSMFYAKSKIDGNVTVWDTLHENALEVSSLQQTGYHRTPNELQDKNTVVQELMGGNISFHSYAFKIGLTGLKTSLSAALKPDSTAEKRYAFRGDENLNFGIDFDLMIGRLNFFGEMSRSKNGGIAGIVGLNASIQSRFRLSVLYRNYGRKYQNLFSGAFAEGSGNQNEEGIYIGASTKINRKLSLSAYADLFQFPWLKFRVDAPSSGKAYFLQASWEEEDYKMYIRYKYKKKALNKSNADSFIPPVSAYIRQNLRFHIAYQISERWHFASRCVLSSYKDHAGIHPGYLVYQDVAYFTPEKDFDIHLRYALFDAADYDARIYAYEHDVLYAFSIPAYYGKGSRIYALLNYKISYHFEFWLRYAINIFTDRDVISSGLNEIKGNKKSEVKFQVRLRF